MLTYLFLVALELFDGTSLAGWSVEGDAQWRVEEGALVADGGGDGFLVSLAEYDNFHLRAEFWVDSETNSGIFIRCRDRHRIDPETCYELNIWDDHPRQEARTGSIVFKVMPPLARVETAGRWNSYDVVASGRRLEVRVNGLLTAILDNADPGAGFIALQRWQDGTVKFRHLSLTPVEK